MSQVRASEKLLANYAANNVRMDAKIDHRLPDVAAESGRAVLMSYAEAKEIALLRQELRSCWDTNDCAGANVALTRLWQVVGNDTELAAEARRWGCKFA